MSDYRDSVNEFKKEGYWTFWKLFPLFVMIVVVVVVMAFSLRSAGLIGGTVIERKVFENSYQRSEALKSEAAQQQAVIQILEQQLVNASTEEGVHIQIQINAARIRLATVRGEQ